MRPNPYAYRQYEKVPEIAVCFANCSKYRVTSVNDEGWYSGQCRFSGLAPEWGEFYEISGNTRDNMNSTPWIEMEGVGAKHFHFYLKDETLEVKAHDWILKSECCPSNNEHHRQLCPAERTFDGPFQWASLPSCRVLCGPVIPFLQDPFRGQVAPCSV